MAWRRLDTILADDFERLGIEPGTSGSAVKRATRPAHTAEEGRTTPLRLKLVSVNDGCAHSPRPSPPVGARPSLILVWNADHAASG